MDKTTPCPSNSFVEFSPIINRTDKNEEKMIMTMMIQTIMIKNDTCTLYE